jgi:hypothetical protein
LAPDERKLSNVDIPKVDNTINTFSKVNSITTTVPKAHSLQTSHTATTKNNRYGQITQKSLLDSPGIPIMKASMPSSMPIPNTNQNSNNGKVVVLGGAEQNTTGILSKLGKGISGLTSKVDYTDLADIGMFANT